GVTVGVKFAPGDPQPDFSLIDGSGGITILPTGFAAAINADLGPDMPDDFLLGPTAGGTADFVARINTTGATQFDVGGSGLDVTAGALAQLDMTAGVSIAGFQLDGDFSLALGPDQFEIEAISVLQLDLGFLGDYEVQADQTFVVNRDTGIQAALSLTFTDPVTPFPVTVSGGEFTLNLDTGNAAGNFVAITAPVIQFWGPDDGGDPAVLFELPMPGGSTSRFLPVAGQFEFSTDVTAMPLDLWSLGIVDIAFDSLRIGSDGSVDIDITFLVAGFAVTFGGLDVTSFSGFTNFRWDRGATADYYVTLGDLSATAGATFSLFDVQLLNEEFTTQLTHWGCLSVDAFGQSYYLNLREAPLGQNVYDPSNQDSCTFDTELPRTATVAFNLADYDPSQLSFSSSGGDSIVRIVTPEGDEDQPSVEVYGLAPGDTVTVDWSVVQLPPSRADTANLEQANDDFVIENGSLVFDANTGSLPLLSIVDDVDFELNERFGLALSINSFSGSLDNADVLFEQAHFTIQNDDRETIGQLVHYDFDDPNTATPYAFRKDADNPNVDASPFVTAGSFTHIDEITPNRAIEFDGNNDYVKILPAAPLPAESFAVELWMKPGEVTGIEPLIALGGGESNMIYVDGDDGKIYVKFANWGGTEYVREIGTYLPDQWQHVAVSNVGGILQVYHNGNVTTYPFVSGSIAYLDDTIFIGGNDDDMPQV
ncbi:MAG: LamG domain-containing protein, partial [Pirellulales bacterium]